MNLVELTVLHENNIDAARARKIDRYVNLRVECKYAGWKVAHFPVEVGCRGLIRYIMRRLLLSLALTHCKANTTINDIQTTVEEASLIFG